MGDSLNREDAVFAVLHRLEADNRRLKRVALTAVTVVGVLVLGAAIKLQGKSDDEAAVVRDVVRTSRLELTNEDGDVVAILQSAERKEEPGWLTTHHDNGRRKWRAQIDDNRYHGSYTEWWPTGLKSEEGTYVKGRKHGLFTTYHKNGQPRARGAYSDGEKAGIWIVFHSNGERHEEGLYEDGERTGLWKGFFASGERAHEHEYEAGAYSGSYRKWHENGQLRMKGKMSAGKPTGDWQFFHDDGAVDEKRTGTYERGKKVR